MSNRKVSRQLIESGIVDVAFPQGSLRAATRRHRFAVYRDAYDRLWLSARREGGGQLSRLHAPSESTDEVAALTQEQWELADRVAIHED